MKLDVLLPATIVGFAAAFLLERTIKHHSDVSVTSQCQDDKCTTTTCINGQCTTTDDSGNVVVHQTGRCAGKGVPGQTPTTMAQCLASGADPQCCLAAAAHHNPGINNPDPCGMKGYYMNNCCNCGQPECSGGNTYPTGSVKPGQKGYECGAQAGIG